MNTYLTITDLKQGVFGEVLNVVTRNEDNCNKAIIEAQAEVESYLCNRYAIGKELEKTTPDNGEDDTRVPMIVKLVRDVALYNAFNISNPVSIPENRRDRYNDAVSFLKLVQCGKASIPSLERLDIADDGSVSANNISYGCSTKRNYQL